MEEEERKINFQIKFTNRALYTFITILVIVVGIFSVFAAQAFNPALPTHPLQQVTTDETGNASVDLNSNSIVDNSDMLEGLRASAFCKSDGTDCQILLPSGMISMFKGTCPSGWSEEVSLKGRVPRGEPTYNTESLDSGGSDNLNLPNHIHEVSRKNWGGDNCTLNSNSIIQYGNLIVGSDKREGVEGLESLCFASNNVDTSSSGGTILSGVNIPAYQEVIFCVKD